MSWWKKSELEKLMAVEARKSDVEKLIAKEGGALESLKSSMCLNEKGELYIFWYCTFDTMVDELAYIVQFRNDYMTKTSTICSKPKHFKGTDSQWLQERSKVISADRIRYLKLKSDMADFGITFKKEQNETENTTGSKSSDASEKTD